MATAIITGDLREGLSEWSRRAIIHASQNNFKVIVTTFNAISDSSLEALADTGVTLELIRISDSNDSEYQYDSAAAEIAQLAQVKGATLLITPPTISGRAIAGRLAVLLKAGLIVDGVIAEGGFSQSVLGGKYLVDVKSLTSISVLIYKSTKVDSLGGKGSITLTELKSPEASQIQVKINTRITESDRPELTEASVVISGGRGVTEQGFDLLEKVADLVGGAVGASRAAVDAGWYPASSQVGQTGKSVNPDVYIAVGISGAIQHKAGMQTSKKIIAINTDPEAPIFEISDISIVGGYKEVLEGALQKINS